MSGDTPSNASQLKLMQIMMNIWFKYDRVALLHITWYIYNITWYTTPLVLSYARSNRMFCNVKHLYVFVD